MKKKTKKISKKKPSPAEIKLMKKRLLEALMETQRLGLLALDEGRSASNPYAHIHKAAQFLEKEYKKWLKTQG